MLYTLIARFLMGCIHLFYKIRVLGHDLPQEGPVILVSNHPNGLLDALMLLSQTHPHHQLRFLAKEPLFRMPIIGSLLRIGKALPVYRKQDGYQGSDNHSIFKAVEEALHQKEWICLFPEGISYHAPHLQPLKTGAARMALGAQDQVDFTLPLKIVPVGLHFVDKGRFRSEAVMTIGQSLDIDGSWQEQYAEDQRQSARDLTQEIERAIKEVTINLESWSDLPLLDLAGQIYSQSDPNWKHSDPIENLQFLAQSYPSFYQKAPQQIEGIRRDLFAFGETLKRFQLEVNDLEKKVSFFRSILFIFKQIIALCIGFPFALLGFILFFIPYQAVRFLAYVKSYDVDIIGTVKLMGGVVFYGVWCGIVCGGIAWMYGLEWAVLSLFLYPLLGLHTLLFIENRTQALQSSLLTLRLLTLGSPKTLLIKERNRIYDQLKALQTQEGQTQEGQTQEGQTQEE